MALPRKLAVRVQTICLKPAQDTAKDPVITSLTSILERAVGNPLPGDELLAAKKEAKQRIAEKIPPGWRDASKRENPEGDYLIWYEMLREAKSRSTDVLFVTGDVKDDWWWREHGEARGPLPELAHEMHAIAGARLFMLRPESLLVHAGNILGIRVALKLSKMHSELPLKWCRTIPILRRTPDGVTVAPISQRPGSAATLPMSGMEPCRRKDGTGYTTRENGSNVRRGSDRIHE